MATMMAGSDGNTKQELLKTLRFEELEISDEPNEHIRSILNKYFETPTGAQLSLANRLFVLRPAHIQVEYSQVLQRSYRADTELLTSIPDIEAKRQHMNKWVAMNTRDKIKNLIPPGVLSANTLLSLISANGNQPSWKILPIQGNFIA
ncbi:hypothetical protein CRM22_005728 [Opisthorchis felineus]|uniref:Serpin domain-containing protein n=1 Tax=Opisthorchis felineus TaxID=147828 RepID=A0A4S2LVS1_OPIFE|nr:hypothetical protein CRM22_005728 [Opisthorchis felineus]